MSKSKSIIWYDYNKTTKKILTSIGFKVKKYKRTKDYLYVNLVFVPSCTAFFLIAFTILQFVGEKIGLAPVIMLSNIGFLTIGESVIMIVIIIATAQVIALNLTVFLIKKMEGIK